jgi:tetratricopeptide (TPR) repeat protein
MMRFIVPVTFLLLGSFYTGHAVEVPFTPIEESESTLSYEWGIVNAEMLLEGGLPVSAAEIFTRLLEDKSLTPEARKRVRLGLTEAYLAQNKFKSAERELLAILDDEATSSLWLLRAMVTYGKGEAVNWDSLEVQMDQIAVTALEARQHYWYFLMKALLAEQKGEADGVNRFFEAGLPKARNAFQRASLQAVVLRGELRGPALDEETLKRLKRDLNKSKGAAAFVYAKQYALALWQSGQAEEALELLNLEKQLKRFGRDFTLAQREQLRLMRAMMLGEDSTDGQLALAELLRSGRTTKVMEVALYLLSRQSEASVIFTELLNELLARKEAHDLIGQMYYLRSQLALRRGELELAKADATLLLEKFPGLVRIGDAYFILAYAALRDDPPRYRTAADFLIQHRAKLEDKAKIAELNVLIGDCYYLNGDFDNAAEFFALALADRPEGLEFIFHRVTIASIRAGKIEAALGYIDKMPLEDAVGVEKRWQAEWNIAQALIREQRAVDALGRVRVLLGEAPDVPDGLYLRMRWLELNLALELNELMPEASQEVDALIARLASTNPAPEQGSRELEMLVSELLLLKAKVHYRQNEVENVGSALADLRENHAESMAAQRSYLLEASELELRGQLPEAQSVMLQLSLDYPESPLVPQAIFEGALICERRGQDFYVEAIQLYERLANSFPEDALVYRARLRQGDLLRLLNDFSGARLIYESLVNNQPDHPMRSLAELSRAQCLLALAKKDADKLIEASLVLERLVDMPDLDLNFRVESMFKWSFSLDARGLQDQAQTVLAQSVARNLLDVKTASALDTTGRYWAARTLLELGERLNASGEFEEAKTIYRKLIAYNLPGRGLAQARINSIQIINN